MIGVIKEIVKYANANGDRTLQSILVSSPFFFICLCIHLSLCLVQDEYRVTAFRDLNKLKAVMEAPLTWRVVYVHHTNIECFKDDVSGCQFLLARYE